MHYLSLKMWWPLSLVALNAVVILATKQQRTKSVTTLIDAQWEATPVVLEVAEFLADENPDYLWSFVDSVSHLEPPLVETSPDKARYERVLAAVSGVLTSTQLSVLKLALSLHIYSPKVEMYAQMARERGVLCPVAVDLAGRLTCDLTELKSLLTQVPPPRCLSQTPTNQPRAGVKLYELDHHYPGSENASTVAVLYGELGTPELALFHELLKIHAAAGTVDYVLRHHVKVLAGILCGDHSYRLFKVLAGILCGDHSYRLFKVLAWDIVWGSFLQTLQDLAVDCETIVACVQERPQRKVRLSGYGVELQIKSTEYKAQDDTQVKGEESSDSSDQDDDEQEVQGFNFNRLGSLYPDLKEDLEVFRQHLLDSSSDMAPLKVWQVQELSLQAAERIMSAPREEALKLMTTIAQNFPLQAKSLVRTPVSEALKKEVKLNQDMFSSSLNLQPTDTALFINGMFFDLDVVDMISLLDVVRQELRVLEGLYKIGISESRMSSILALDFSGGSSSNQEYAIDIRDSAVMWVNDIEHDKQYRRWSDSLMELLRPTFPGMLRSIRRNLYHLVIIADPAKLEARPLLKLAESFYVHTAPLRLGLVFAVNPDETVSGLEDPGVAMLNAFNYASEQKDAYSGLAFITDVYAAVKEDRDITVEDVRTQLKSKYPQGNVEEILGEDSEYNTGRKLAKDFLERSGFRRHPQVSCIWGFECEGYIQLVGVRATSSCGCEGYIQLWCLAPQVLLNGVPLSDKSLTSDEFEEAVLTEIMSQTPTFQKAVYKGEFSDSDDSLDFIMNQANVMPRSDTLAPSMQLSLGRGGGYKFSLSLSTKRARQLIQLVPLLSRLNDRVLNQDNQHYLDMSGALPTDTKTDNFPSLSTRDKTAMLVGHMRYFSTRRQHGDNGHPVILTHWIVGDMDSSEGRHLLHHALEQMLSSGSVRVGLLVNPLHNSGSRLLNQLVLAALETLPPNQARHYISTILASDTLSQAIGSGEKDPQDVIVQGVDLSNLTLVWQQFKSDFTTLNTHQTYSRTVLNLSPGARAVVTNGRVLGPLDAGERFTTDDFSLLERFNMNNYGDKLLALLKKQGDDDDVVTSDILMQTVALLVSRTQSRSRFEIPFKGEEYSVVNLPPRNPSEPILDLVAVVDPVSRGAQKVGPILSVLQEVLNCNIRLFLNCVEKHSDMPLKRSATMQLTPSLVSSPSFYRFVVEPELQFVGEGHHSPGPVARFTNMPESTLFTQNMHVPENWLVESVRSLYDLDNIRLEDVDSGVHSKPSGRLGTGQVPQRSNSSARLLLLVLLKLTRCVASLAVDDVACSILPLRRPPADLVQETRPAGSSVRVESRDPTGRRDGTGGMADHRGNHVEASATLQSSSSSSMFLSEFELEYLLLEGHCFEASMGNPPRGLQITLGTELEPVKVDTIVMANLGYFQLKANPGAWTLRLRQGRSAEIFDIVSQEGTDTPTNSSDIKVLVSSFKSHVLKLKVSKKPDKMHMDLLSEDDSAAAAGLWGSITSFPYHVWEQRALERLLQPIMAVCSKCSHAHYMHSRQQTTKKTLHYVSCVPSTFGGSSKEEDDKEQKINIFSVASGHLYERFLRIMMLSVLKHTNTPVKFWFLKNYLSPTLKVMLHWRKHCLVSGRHGNCSGRLTVGMITARYSDQIDCWHDYCSDYLPHMAQEYGFEYELVQYKWPRWLHQQREKQRIIWGYKILFLDVLFPLDVKKIIFVDADQVVRADMKELVDLDLGGAPYGYTPFCESRTEMEGFRFWKTGYWRNHLQGRRYHISALYVVDLRRFRRIAAGDRLRGQYQALSQDPNSLSNLDQDLPNNMIHQVAIKSLPQEWLWCETWCDNDSKRLAKTIDLCNNPLTKEAKLTAAMRIVEEWKDYDAELKRIQKKMDDSQAEDIGEVHQHTHTIEQKHGHVMSSNPITRFPPHRRELFC
uniref:UDP-glucose:glycoprotein glucosyltransferase n=1 Tax=Timema monikensis TaxID=170555 RepID=A0A7R9E8W2_9NEOP|nr:unnamed protein product [Timema monikensis]